MVAILNRHRALPELVVEDFPVIVVNATATGAIFYQEGAVEKLSENGLDGLKGFSSPSAVEGRSGSDIRL